MSVRGTYYNEIDSYCAAWLRNFVAAGQVADGEVDERDVKLVRPAEVRCYERAHFFAGMAGWDYDSGKLVGPTIDQYGRGVAHASHSARQQKKRRGRFATMT